MDLRHRRPARGSPDVRCHTGRSRSGRAHAPSPALVLARDLVALHSDGSLSNLAVAERIVAELAGFKPERLDFTEAAGVAERALVAHCGPP